jgi:hypothetical protein
MNEMPTRDDTLVVLKIKTPPCLYIPRVEVELSEECRVVPLPVKVRLLAIGWSKWPQK